ncbi:uncharacterized protein LOC129586708 [Paramacrobiotus metropolitanus]|uniref:uncharacterized protein LOC129586708 n=1 Tax=Paramacrobiotus metropolitanus TaxID=2943436 RepID=UPI002445A93E|nr:uncharacterized protein LOC129586708 [Paramacrobiotus metropolitanus]
MWFLLAALLSSSLYTVNAIKCYECEEFSGTNPGNLRVSDSTWTAKCLSTKSTDCPQEVKNCVRGTEIYYKPNSWEKNYQHCGDGRGLDDLTCADEYDYMSYPANSSRNTKTRTLKCYCAGDNCNPAWKLVANVPQQLLIWACSAIHSFKYWRNK